MASIISNQIMTVRMRDGKAAQANRVCYLAGLMSEAVRNSTRFIFILGAMITISPFSIDMYLPAFEKIAADFHTTPSRVSLSLSSYFIGLAIGMIFYGPFLDRFGRKRPLYIGLSIYILASLACMFSTSVNSLIAARFFQALGGCSASVAATAMVRDFFTPMEGVKVFSRLMLILSVSPLFAPTVGGWVVSQFGWHAVFFVLASIVFLFLILIHFFLPEGHPPDKSVQLKPRAIFKTFLYVLKNQQFFAFTLAGALSFAGLFAYLAGAPAIFLSTFHLSENMFGLIFAFLSIGMVGGGQFNIWLLNRFTSPQIFSFALMIQVLMAIIFAVGCIYGEWGLYQHIAIFFVFISCIGLVSPNSAALAMAPFEKNSGSASALLGTIQMGTGALAAAGFGFLKMGASLAVAIMFVVTSILALFVFRICANKDVTLGSETSGASSIH